MPDINGIPYVESSDLVSAYPAVSQSLAQAVSDQLAEKLPYSYGTATPSTTDSGFLWYDSNSTPAAPKFWNGSAFVDFPSGMSLVTSESFSAVSSVSINGCFTASYDYYQVIMDITTSNVGSMRLRASGTDDTSSNYAWQQGFFDGAAALGERITGTTSARILNGNATSTNTPVIIQVLNPAVASITQWFGQSLRNITAPVLIPLSAVHNVASAYDGFTITGTATMTGTIKVYGYKD